jgi:diguanylate cyclase (GGDEF)-like protein/PAS domain S-box-containing protein
MTADETMQNNALVLVVDDDRLMRTIFRDALETAGYRTLEAADGNAAVSSFHEARPDLILLDMVMPGMDGLQTCRAIRQLPGGLYIPVLMVTSMGESWAVHEAYDAGTTDFIAKPVNPELLTYRVEYMLRASRSMRNLAASEAQLAHAQQIAALGNWEWDTGTGALYCSREALRILGLPGNRTATFADFLDTILPPDRAEVETRLRSAFSTTAPYIGECRINSNGDQPRTVRLQAYAERVTDRAAAHMVGTIQDVTDMKQAENSLRLLKTAIDSLPIGITMSDTDGNIIYANPAEAKMHGRTVSELQGRKAAEFAPPSMKNPPLPELVDQNEVWRRESTNIRSNGEEFPVQLSSIAVRDEAGRCLGMVTACEDMTHWKETEQRINQLAYYDTLTGLPNRRTFFDRLNQALSLASRENRLVGLLFLDLDNFKDINDTLGHEYGDRFLREVADRLGEVMRESDTLARIGGDEFVILLTALSSQVGAAIAARRILALISRPFTMEGKQLFSSASIGIALYPDDGHDQDSLFKCADTAMYHAKETGKGTFRFFSSELNLKIMRRVALENGLRQGIGNNEFFMMYQPQWDLQNNRMIGVEALIRWQSPEFGLVMPTEFISLAEVSGLIIPLGEWVLRTACGQLRIWQEHGYSRLRVAINISGKQLTQADFLENTRKIIATSGVDPASLELEFTESVLMDNAEKAIGTLRELKQLGLRLSIDDFGTGYSSLSYLKHFPIDRVKIDRSFVTDVTVNSDDAAIVTAIISMSHSLNLQVIAEGVETMEQMQFLQGHGCDEIQGYYLARPLSAEDVGRRLADGS